VHVARMFGCHRVTSATSFLTCTRLFAREYVESVLMHASAVGS
jgi:hypothetical protein